MISLRKKNWKVNLYRPTEGGGKEYRTEVAVARSKTQAELAVILRVPGLWFVSDTHSDDEIRKAA